MTLIFIATANLDPELSRHGEIRRRQVERLEDLAAISFIPTGEGDGANAWLTVTTINPVEAGTGPRERATPPAGARGRGPHGAEADAVPSVYADARMAGTESSPVGSATGRPGVAH